MSIDRIESRSIRFRVVSVLSPAGLLPSSLKQTERIHLYMHRAIRRPTMPLFHHRRSTTWCHIAASGPLMFVWVGMWVWVSACLGLVARGVDAQPAQQAQKQQPDTVGYHQGWTLAQYPDPTKVCVWVGE